MRLVSSSRPVALLTRAFWLRIVCPKLDSISAWAWRLGKNDPSTERVLD